MTIAAVTAVRAVLTTQLAWQGTAKGSVQQIRASISGCKHGRVSHDPAA
jgi:hypothetical protein